jgi:hypothetical protein
MTRLPSIEVLQRISAVVFFSVVSLCLFDQPLLSQCSAHRLTTGTLTNLGWPSGSKVSVSFEAGNTGDLTPAQQQQWISGMQYWTQSGSNYGNLTFVNSGTSANPI